MVYVDDMKRAWRSMSWLHTMKMSHMIADTTDELLAMADRLGLNRKWMQNAGTAREHFDVGFVNQTGDGRPPGRKRDHAAATGDDDKRGKMHKEYLGDSVYADIQGGHLELTTNNGNGPSNKILLNREVLHALRLYLETYHGMIE